MVNDCRNDWEKNKVMTRKETIQILHDLYNYYNDKSVDGYVGFDHEDNEAIELAVKSLEAWDKVIKGLKKWRDDDDNMNTPHECFDDALLLVEKYCQSLISI